MILIALGAVPAGSKPPAAVGVRISTMRDTALALQRLCRPGRHPWKEELSFSYYAGAGQTRRAAIDPRR